MHFSLEDPSWKFICCSPSSNTDSAALSVTTTNSPFQFKSAALIDPSSVHTGTEISMMNFNVTHRDVEVVIFLHRTESLKNVLVKLWPPSILHSGPVVSSGEF